MKPTLEEAQIMKPGALSRGPKEVKPAACEGPTVGETWSLRGAQSRRKIALAQGLKLVKPGTLEEAQSR